MRPWSKIVDDELLEMHRQGIPQKDMAAHFGCSPVAVFNRLKRLLPVASLVHRHDLTEKEKVFCLEKAKDASHMKAAIAAYNPSTPESAKAMGTALMRKPEIKETIQELMEVCGLTTEYRVVKLKGHVDNRDPNVSLKALDMTSILDDSYPPQRSVNLNLNADLSPVDLTKYRKPPPRRKRIEHGADVGGLGKGYSRSMMQEGLPPSPGWGWYRP